MADSWLPAVRKLTRSPEVAWAFGVAAAGWGIAWPWLQERASVDQLQVVQDQVATPAEVLTLPLQDGKIVTLTARVKACEARGFEIEQRLRERRQIEGELLEAVVRIAAASAEPKATRRAAAGREAVDQYRDLIRRDTPPLEALRVVLETKPP